MTELCRLRQVVEIQETAKGFALTFQADRTTGVPVEVEINMRPGARLGIKFGPRPQPHSYFHMRGADPELPGENAYFTGVTPFRQTLEFTAL